MEGSQPTPPITGSCTEEDGSALVVCLESSRLEALFAGAADWVIDEGVAEIGHSQGLRDHPAGGVEWVGAEDEAGLAVLLEGDAVVHTAR